VSNLRVFKLGFGDTNDRLVHNTMFGPFASCNAPQVVRLLQKCPRLEELHLNTDLRNLSALFAHPALGQLRVLQYYHGRNYGRRADANPLRGLANNPHLKRLTTLRLHPSSSALITWELLNALLGTPSLGSLTHLQLRMSTFGDAGANSLVQSGVLRRLEVLDIGYGTMTDAGARRLASCPDLKRLQTLDVSRNALTSQGIDALRGTGIQVIADEQNASGIYAHIFEGDYE
jgi:hypothetical protein